MNDVLIKWDIVNGVRVLVASKRNYKVVHNKVNGSSGEAAPLPKNRSNNSNSNLAISNHSNHLAPSITPATNQLPIRTKNVIPSKDKSQQQHLSAASNSPSNYKKEDYKTKDKHQFKQQSETTDLFDIFGTPIKTKSSSSKDLKELKSKKSKSSSEKSTNSRSSTPSSISHLKEYSDNNSKKLKDGKLNKSHNSSNSSSNSHSRSLLAKDDKFNELMNRVKKENDQFYDTSPFKLSKSSPVSVASKFSELDKLDKNNNKFHSKNLSKSNLSSSSSSINSYDSRSHRSRSKAKNKKRKKRSDSISSSDSHRSSSASSAKSFVSARSLSSSSLHSIKQRKRNNKDRDSPVKKKKKESSSKIKKESNISASRTLSSSLSSINSSDYKLKDQKIKNKLKDDYYSKVKDRHSPEPKFKKEEDEEKSSKKERKEKKSKNKDESSSKKSNKKSKSSKDSKDEKKHKANQRPESSRDLSEEKIVKEKNKDLINKQTSHKENNLKKESTTSTKISLSNNNSTGVTTLEISSFKNVKMLQSESKRSKQHQDQLINQSDKRSFKESKNKSNHYSSPLIDNKKVYDNETPSSSPCSTSNYVNSSNKNGKDIKDDYQAKRNQKLNSSYEKIMSDMRKDREISPLSSDLNSDLEFNLDNEYASNDESALKNSNYKLLNESDIEDKKLKRKSNRPSYLDESDESDEYVHMEYVNELIHLQKQIRELKDKELLTEIVDIVRESGLFEMNGTLFDFDLMKLDKTTVKKVKLCFS